MPYQISRTHHRHFLFRIVNSLPFLRHVALRVIRTLGVQQRHDKAIPLPAVSFHAHIHSAPSSSNLRVREVYYEIWISTDPTLGAPHPPNPSWRWFQMHTMLTINLTRTPATLIHNELRRHSRYRSSMQVRGIPITTNLYTSHKEGDSVFGRDLPHTHSAPASRKSH